MTDEAIVIRGLRKRYDGRAVLDGIDLEVGRASIFALLGPNGAGKTTTVEIIEGYRSADEGNVRVLGLDPGHDHRRLSGRVGLMLQAGGIYPQATPREMVRLCARMYRAPLDPDWLLEEVGLGDAARTRYRVLSGGQRQRLGLALAIVGRPELVLLDEPTAGMDPAGKAASRALVAGLRDAGVTVVVTTHELVDAEQLADQIAIIDRGRIVAEGTVAELAAGGEPRLRFRLPAELDPESRTALGVALGGPLELDHGVGRYVFGGAEPTPATVVALTSWCAERGLLVSEIRTAGATLEERYLELTGGTGASSAAPLAALTP